MGLQLCPQLAIFYTVLFAVFPYWFSRPMFSKCTSFKITMIWKSIKLLIHPCIKLDYFTIRYIVQILVFIFNPKVIGNRINFVKHFIGIIDSSFEYDTSTCNTRWTNGLEIETSQIYRTRRSFGMIERGHYFSAGLVFKGHWFQLF